MNTTRLADAGVVVSWAGWIIAKFAEWNPVIQGIAGLVAIVAGLLAARFHWLKAQELKNDRNTE